MIGGGCGLILRQLWILEHSHQHEGGLGGRWRARRIRRLRQAPEALRAAWRVAGEAS